MIADEMAPEAVDRSRPFSGPATVTGFALAVWLTGLEETNRRDGPSR